MSRDRRGAGCCIWTATAPTQQRAALEAIFSGRLGGDAERHFPWAWKASELLAVRPVEIDVNHTQRRQRLRIREHVSVRIRDRYHGGETVTCVIPGHERTGEELVADELLVEDSALAFSYRGVCGYGSDFDYAGEGSVQLAAERLRICRHRAPMGGRIWLMR